MEKTAMTAALAWALMHRMLGTELPAPAFAAAQDRIKVGEAVFVICLDPAHISNGVNNLAARAHELDSLEDLDDFLKSHSIGRNGRVLFRLVAVTQSKLREFLANVADAEASYARAEESAA